MNKFIFLSFWTINFDAVFDDLFVNLFALTKLKVICNSNDQDPNRDLWIQNIPLFKMANYPDRNVRAAKKDNTNWSKMRWFSFQKINLHFAYWNPGPNRPIFRDIRGRNILPVKNTMKCDSTFKNHNHKDGSTIDVFLIFFVPA